MADPLVEMIVKELLAGNDPRLAFANWQASASRTGSPQTIHELLPDILRSLQGKMSRTDREAERLRIMSAIRAIQAEQRREHRNS